MKIWDTYPQFNEEYLKQHHGIVLADIFHRIKASILYPPCYNCETDCRCRELRTQVILSLNVAFLKMAEAEQRDPAYISAVKSILCIPEDSYFKENWNTAYPLWLIKNEFRSKEKSHHFKIVDRLVWALLRLGKTYEASIYRERRTSLNEAIDLILGDTPLKSGVSRGDYLCGEKAYGKHFKVYKPVCHFIAAFEYIQKETALGADYPFVLKSPSQIERFLKLSKWFRDVLLSQKTHNVKNNTLFSDDLLLSLPSWVISGDVNISIASLVESSDGVKALSL